MHRASGFTLVELLIAVVIFAMISAVAVPIYTEYTQRGFRVELQGDLMACGQALERFNAINFTYVGAVDTDADGLPNAGAANGTIATSLCNPGSVQQGRYAVTVTTTATTYLLTAVPAGPMLNTGNLTLDQAGNRTWDEANDGIGATDNDWEKG